jgi:hypothetical protein
VAVLFLALMVAACSGGVLGTGADCTGSTALVTQVSGSCTRSIDELSEAETQSIVVQTSDVAPFASIDLVVAVETGSVDVTIVDARGDKQTVRAGPGRDASASLRIRLDALNRIRFDLAPVDGPARNVSYELQFVCDCLP